MGNECWLLWFLPTNPVLHINYLDETISTKSTPPKFDKSKELYYYENNISSMYEGWCELNNTEIKALIMFIALIVYRW